MDQKISEQESNNRLPGYKVFFKIMSYREHKAPYLIALLLGLIGGITPLAQNIIIGNITNDITTSDNFMESVKKNIIYFAIFAFIFTLMWFFKDIAMGIATPRFLSDIRSKLFMKYMDLDISYFDQYQTGSLLDRITTDCMTMSSIYMEKFIIMSTDLTQTVAGVVLSFIVSWRVTIASFIVFPVCIVAFFVCEYFIGRLWEKYNNATNNAGSKAEEVINSFRTVKSFDNELKEAEKYKQSLSEVLNVVKKTSLITGTKDGIIFCFINVMIIGFLYYSVWIIYKHPEWGMENGDIMVLVMSLIFSALGVYQSLALIEDFRKANESGRKVLEILETPIKVDNNKGDEKDTTVTGKIEFRNVCFKYQNKENYAVKNLSFTVNPGETVALVGESGCGKSTTLQLLQRFYEIESGEILIDDVNIKTFSPRYLRSQISVVPQTPALFSMSIRDNIRYCSPDASEKLVSDSAISANAHNFIMTLPENYETIVKPTSLSGGQKQRICIARAILANSPILMLDEATAALDTESERLVQESLEKIREGKTAIIVAHRLSTVMNADRIYVFRDGSIVETGTHEELLKQGGYYADLIKFQLQQ